MAYRIVFEDGRSFTQPENAKSVVSPCAGGREWRAIALNGGATEIKEAFTDGARYRQEWDSLITVHGGEYTQTETLWRDLSEWSVAGEVVDHRDGTCTVLMGKPTKQEILEKRLAEAEAALLALTSVEQ